MALTSKQRAALPDSDFAVPGKRALPMHDATHVKLAWDMVERTEDLTDAERKDARSRIKARARELGVDTSGWQLHAMTLQGMAVAFPEATPDHPNKHPFSGILTRLDQPSDNPVGGAEKRRVLLPRAVAEAALPTLLGMAVDFTPNLKGHDPQKKIGLITDAEIIDDAGGPAIQIAGYFYKKDYPDQVAQIVAEKDLMGFSYELEAAVEDDTDPDLLTVSYCQFTGAAVLYAANAAYVTTTLTANADETEIVMNEELKAALEAINSAIAGVASKVDGMEGRMHKLEAAAEVNLQAASVAHKVTAHVANLRAAADAMEADGLGMDEKRGHVKVLRNMADSIESDAVNGKLPHVYSTSDCYYASAEQSAAETAPAAAPAAPAAAVPVALEAAAAPTAPAIDQATAELIAGLQTQVKELQGKAFHAAAAPERKTVSGAVMTLLARAGITVPEGDDKMNLHDVDKALGDSSLTRVQRIEVKQRLMEAGKL